MTNGEIYMENPEAIPVELRYLFDAELKTPVQIKPDNGLRVKVTDNCGMTCVFCHNEGTPVTLVNQKAERVSIYQKTNGVDFNAHPFQKGGNLLSHVDMLRDRIGIDEVHFTGGEPTLNRDIVALTESLTANGYTVKMTSNGESGALRIANLAAAGLKSINFSIFGTTPEEIASIQAERFRNPKFGAAKLRKLHEAMRAAIDNGIEAKANVVIISDADHERVSRILDKYGNEVSIRLLPSLDDGMQSILSIYRFMDSHGALPVRRKIAAGSSNIRTDFRLPSGNIIGFKQINKVILPETCAPCDMKNTSDCNEGYYGPRLYLDQNGNTQVGICIQRMDLTRKLSEFLDSTLPDEIKKFKEEETQKMRLKYNEWCCV